MKIHLLLVRVLTLVLVQTTLYAQNKGNNNPDESSAVNTGSFYCAAESVDIQVFNGLTGTGGTGGQEVPLDKEETIGAVTVANKNDTDSDGIDDFNDNDVRLSDKGRDEIDLIKIIVNRPSGSTNSQTVKLRLSKGGVTGNKHPDLELWALPTKGTKIPFYSLGGSSLADYVEIKCADLPMTYYLEVKQESQSFQDIQIKLEFGSQFDLVKATALWVKLIQSEIEMTRDNCGCTPSSDPLSCTCVKNKHLGNTSASYTIPYIMQSDFEYLINGQYRSKDMSRYGYGLMTNDNGYHGARFFFPFEILPNTMTKAQLESLNVYFDITRDIDATFYGVRWAKSGIVPLSSGGSQSSAQNELPNDDPDAKDEDNAPELHNGKLKIGSGDTPNFKLSQAASSTYAYAVRKTSFREWVRITIGEAIPEMSNEVIGSRCSGKQDWSYVGYYVKDEQFGGTGLYREDNTKFTHTKVESYALGNDWSLNVSEIPSNDEIARSYVIKHNAGKVSLFYQHETTNTQVPIIENIAPSATSPKKWEFTDPGKVKFTLTEGTTPFSDIDDFKTVVFRRAMGLNKLNGQSLMKYEVTEINP